MACRITMYWNAGTSGPPQPSQGRSWLNFRPKVLGFSFTSFSPHLAAFFLNRQVQLDDSLVRNVRNLTGIFFVKPCQQDDRFSGREKFFEPLHD